MKKLKNITVIFNKAEDLNLAADTDTQKTAEDVAATLAKMYDVDLLGLFPEDIHKIKNIKSDIVFNLVEWSHIHLHDALKVIDTLEKAGLPFTGSSKYGYELSSNKILMKKTMDKFSVPTPKWMEIITGDEEVINFTYPVIVKPSAQHCGIGVGQDSLANSAEEVLTKAKKLIAEFHEPIIAEEYIEGRELHITVLERNGEPWVLPAFEVLFSNEENFIHVLSYDGKWSEDSEEYTKTIAALAKLTPALQAKVDAVAVDCFKKLGGHDYPRLDLRIRGDEVFVLEINNNPGIDYSDESGFGLSGKAAGFTYEEILSHIVENAYSRFSNTAYDAITT